MGKSLAFTPQIKQLSYFFEICIHGANIIKSFLFEKHLDKLSVRWLYIFLSAKRGGDATLGCAGLSAVKR